MSKKTSHHHLRKKDLYPTSVLVNKRGEVLKTFVGEPNFNELYQTVDLELAK